MHMLVSWFDTVHRSTAQVSWHISQQTQNLERYLTTKLKSGSKFGRYIMIAKEANYFNFFWPYSLSEVIKLPWSIYIFHPILCFSLILCSFPLHKTAPEIILLSVNDYNFCTSFIICGVIFPLSFALKLMTSPPQSYY